jgi:hypothetical protein
MRNWGALFAPQRCEVCGQVHLPTGADRPGQLSDVLQASSQLWDSLLAPWMQALQTAWSPAVQGLPKAHTADCDCPRCMPDDCHCRCCVASADLLVYARAGERRMVPLVLENNRRRERAVELELSDWTSHDGRSTQVTGQLAPPTTFILQPCEERTVLLAIEVVGKQADTAIDAKATTDTNRTPAPNLDECMVFYADLRVKGCDIRPIRIAVAVLPGDCAAYRIDCRCVCC